MENQPVILEQPIQDTVKNHYEIGKTRGFQKAREYAQEYGNNVFLADFQVVLSWSPIHERLNPNYHRKEVADHVNYENGFIYGMKDYRDLIKNKL